LTTEFLPVSPAALFAVSVPALVASDFVNWRPGRYLFKPLAALAFIWLAVSLDATATAYGRWLLAGLVFCALGDLFLMPDDDRSFLAGLGAFLLGHLLYAVAFLQLPANATGLAVSAVPALVLAAVVLRWLLPHVDVPMKVPVTVYTLVITTMLLCAGLTVGHAVAWLAVTGAWGFALSDIAVARQQFVHKARANPLWGTPLYFAAQMMLAGSVAAAVPQ